MKGFEFLRIRWSICIATWTDARFGIVRLRIVKHIKIKNKSVLSCRLKYSNILPRIFLIQIIAPLFPTGDASPQIADAFKAFGF